MDLNFEELKLLTSEFLTNVSLVNCLTDNIISEKGYEANSIAVLASDKAYDKVEVLSKLLVEFLKYRPLPF